jgi:hypothetical protein
MKKLLFIIGLVVMLSSNALAGEWFYAQTIRTAGEASVQYTKEIKIPKNELYTFTLPNGTYCVIGKEEKVDIGQYPFQLRKLACEISKDLLVSIDAAHCSMLDKFNMSTLTLTIGNQKEYSLQLLYREVASQ